MKKNISFVLTAMLVLLGFSCGRQPAKPAAQVPQPQQGGALPEGVLPPSTVTGDIQIQQGLTPDDKQYVTDTNNSAPTENINPDSLLRTRKK